MLRLVTRRHRLFAFTCCRTDGRLESSYPQLKLQVKASVLFNGGVLSMSSETKSDYSPLTSTQPRDVKFRKSTSRGGRRRNGSTTSGRERRVRPKTGRVSASRQLPHPLPHPRLHHPRLRLYHLRRQHRRRRSRTQRSSLQAAAQRSPVSATGSLLPSMRRDSLARVRPAGLPSQQTGT